MTLAIKIIGILIGAVGIFYISKPEGLKWAIRFFSKGWRIYWLGSVRFVLGAFFLLAASSCRIGWIIMAFGLIFLLSSLLIFWLGAERIRSMLGWYDKRPGWLFRIFGIIAVIFGVAILYAV